MDSLMSFFKDLWQSLTSPGGPLPDGSCCLERPTRFKPVVYPDRAPQ
jgi:hypothetical protein